MVETSPTFWVVVATGAASGLLSSIVGYSLLGVPLVRVKVRHDLRVNDSGVHIDSYVKVANIRGRPVKIEHVFILRRGTRGRPPMSRPRQWVFPEQPLSEGAAALFTFDRADYPNAVAVAMDSAGRIWPRRRGFRVRRHALWAGGIVGWPWQRNGPTERQMARAKERFVRKPTATTP